MHIIIMPPHIIMQGMPAFIMAIMRVQHSLNMAMSMPGIGMHFITMPPPGIISQVILPIMAGIITGIIWGIIWGIMGIPPMPICGIIPPIGIMPDIILGIGIMPPVMGICIAVIMARSVSLQSRTDVASAEIRDPAWASLAAAPPSG
ncbi:hypothetical protein [Azospirillum sp. TSO22-1]|uniref:hypothetical protein n=1 Tax=Azospirillum sp. TSO22-1 TaxID=716789 RepID=UPI0013047F58|nr:hypothetical protein [Azospirillum sp. TSO22-1]